MLISFSDRVNERRRNLKEASRECAGGVQTVNHRRQAAEVDAEPEFLSCQLRFRFQVTESLLYLVEHFTEVLWREARISNLKVPLNFPAKSAALTVHGRFGRVNNDCFQMVKYLVHAQVFHTRGGRQLTVLLDVPNPEPRECVPAAGQIIAKMLPESIAQTLSTSLSNVHEPKARVEYINSQLVPEVYLVPTFLSLQDAE
jgi:hypothetical protein